MQLQGLSFVIYRLAVDQCNIMNIWQRSHCPEPDIIMIKKAWVQIQQAQDELKQLAQASGFWRFSSIAYTSGGGGFGA